MKRVVYNTLYAFGAVALFVLAWVLAHAVVGNELLVPALSTTLRATATLLLKGAFWRAVFASLLRVLVAFCISFSFALACAVLAYALPIFRRVFAPFASFLRSLPTLCVLLVILLWTNAGVAPVVVAFLSLFPMLYAGLLAGLCAVDKTLLEMSEVYRVPFKRRLARLYLPSVLPYAVREGTAGLSFALKLVVSAEVLAGAYKSLGFFMQEAKTYLETPTLFALVIVTFAIGLILECLGETLVRVIERWRA